MHDPDLIKQRIQELKQYTMQINQQLNSRHQLQNLSEDYQALHKQQKHKYLALQHNQQCHSLFKINQSSISQLSQQQSINTRLSHKILEIQQKIKKKRQSFANISNNTNIKRTQPYNVRMFVSRFKIVDDLSKIHEQLVVDDTQQSDHFKQYSLYVANKDSLFFSQMQSKKTSNSNKRIQTSINDQKKTKKKLQNEHKNNSFIICLCLQDLTIKKLYCHDIITQSFRSHKNLLQFQAITQIQEQSQNKREHEIRQQTLTFIMQLNNQKHFNMWQTFLQQLSSHKKCQNLNQKWDYKNTNKIINNYNDQQLQYSQNISNIEPEYQPYQRKNVRKLTVPFYDIQKDIMNKFEYHHSLHKKETIKSENVILPIAELNNSIQLDKKKHITFQRQNIRMQYLTIQDTEQKQLRSPILSKSKYSQNSSEMMSAKLHKKNQQKQKLLSSPLTKTHIYWMEDAKNNSNYYELMSADNKSQVLTSRKNSQTIQPKQASRPIKKSFASGSSSRNNQNLKNETNPMKLDQTETGAKTPSKDGSQSGNSKKNSIDKDSGTNHHDRNYGHNNLANLQSKQQAQKNVLNRVKKYSKHLPQNTLARKKSQKSSIYQKTRKDYSQQGLSSSPTKHKRSNKKQLRMIAQKQAMLVRDIYRSNSNAKKPYDNDSDQNDRLQTKSRIHSKSRRPSNSQISSKNIKSGRLNKHNKSTASNNKDINMMNAEDGFEDASEDSEETSMSSSDQAEDQKIGIEQLKNGIVLWKYSANGWSPYQKKLFLSRNQFQLCYSDIKNSIDQKKVFIHDIISIQYQKFGKGVIHHLKGDVDRDRCMMISYKTKKGPKYLQFMLSLTQPIYNIKQFVRKLQRHIENCDYEPFNQQQMQE